MTKVLHLNVKSEYYDSFISGDKTEEYRICNEYWRKRLESKNYGVIHYKKGYPKNNDTNKIYKMPFNGFTKKIIQHKHFGDSPIMVYAIKLTKETK